MLALLVCHCAGAENKCRRVLKEAGIKGYMSVSCYTGTKSGEIFLESLPANLKEQTDWKGAMEAVKSKSSYAIILGYNNMHILWEDIRSGDLMQTIRAEHIADLFD